MRADHTTSVYAVTRGHSWSEEMLIHWFMSTQLGVIGYYAAASARVKRPKKPTIYQLPEVLRPKADQEKKALGTSRPVEEIDDWLLRKNGR